VTFEFIYNLTINHGWYVFGKTNAVGFLLELLLLGALFKLGSDASWMHIGDCCRYKGGESIQTFSLQFYKQMAAAKDDFIYMPRNEDKLQKVHLDYALVGFPDCVRSKDGVHIGWDQCRAGLLNEWKGKEKYPSIGYHVIGSNHKFIMFISDGFPGAWNDAIAAKYIELVNQLHDSKHFLSQFEFKILTSDMEHKVMQACYLIYDGGYLHWPGLLVSPMKDPSNEHVLKFSKLKRINLQGY